MVIGPDDWANLRPPPIEEVERLATEAFRSLPASVRRSCDGLVIRVVDFPDDATLDEMGAESAFDLLGLFRGAGLAQGAFPERLETGQMPNMVWLYRRPILDAWSEGDDTLGALVAHVLIHEIGHHVGLSDDDMERIEAAADEAR